MKNARVLQPILKALPLSRQQLAGPMIVCGIAIACQLLPTDLLLYERTLVLNAEIWRLVSANLIHLNTIHVLLNILGVVILWLLHGDYYDTKLFLIVVTTTSLATTLGLLAFFADVPWYAGLSGAMHGVFVWGLAQDFKTGQRTAWVLLLGLLIKLGWEFFYGADSGLEELIGARVAIEAHLCGTVGGILYIAVAGFLETKRQAQSP